MTAGRRTGSEILALVERHVGKRDEHEWPTGATPRLIAERSRARAAPRRPLVPMSGLVRLLGAIEAGEVKAVLAWHADRLHRRPRELEETTRGGYGEPLYPPIL